MMKLSHALLLVLLLSFAAQPVHAFNDSDVTATSNINQPEATAPELSITADQIKTALTSWVAAIESGSSTAVTPLYADNAILLPTLSSKILTTPEGRKEYFDKFTAQKNLKAELIQAVVRVYGDVAIASGLYNFSFLEHGKTVTIPARFSFVYIKAENGNLMIVEHHSSKLPK